MYINKSTYWAMVLAIVVGAVAGWSGSYCCQKINEHWQLVDTVSQNHIYVLQCVESRQRETIAAQRQRIAELERQLQEKGK